MTISSETALKLICKYKREDNIYRINHSICVGKCAEKIAKALGINSDKAKTLGLLHDIGKVIDATKSHTVFGYEYLKSLGLSEEYCSVCLTHSYLNNDYKCTAGQPIDVKFRTEYVKNHNYTVYDKIINISDLICTDKIIGLDKRIIQIIISRGTSENTQYHIIESYKLKKEFDDLLGHNLYELFPEVAMNI